MAKLEIKLSEAGRKRKEEAIEKQGIHIPTWQDYDFLVDGHEPTHLTAFELDFNKESFPEVKLSFFADDLQIDVDTLAHMKWLVEQKEGDS